MQESREIKRLPLLAQSQAIDWEGTQGRISEGEQSFAGQSEHAAIGKGEFHVII